VPLTLVPSTLAKKGYRFTFAGPNKDIECAACPFQKLCFGLEPGRTYEVRQVRDVQHPCELHDEGKVRAVAVEEVTFPSSIERKHLRGTAAHWTPVDCGRPSCANWSLCHPVGHSSGAKHAIVKTHGAVECPAGFDVERVDLKKMD
jgi:uncharacterized protein